MNREAVYVAFEALLKTVPGFVTVSRRQILIENCDSSLMPALYIREDRDKVFARSMDGIETMDLMVDVFIYIQMADDQTPPGPIYNPLIDAVLQKFPPDSPLPETANGSQFNCFFGDVIKYEGLLGNKAVAYIPVIIRASYDAG